MGLKSGPYSGDKFFHSILGKPCLYGAFFVHRGIDILEQVWVRPKFSVRKSYSYGIERQLCDSHLLAVVWGRPTYGIVMVTVQIIFVPCGMDTKGTKDVCLRLPHMQQEKLWFSIWFHWVRMSITICKKTKILCCKTMTWKGLSS